MSSHASSEPEPAAASLSASQRARFASALRRAKRVLLVGRAGAGKTTTLCPGIEQMVESGRTGLLAFNRAVVAELARRVSHLGKNVHLATVDAERFACYRAAHPDERYLRADEQIALVKQSLLECRGGDPDAPRLAGWYLSQLQQGSEPQAVLGKETAARYDELKGAHDRFDACDVAHYLADDPERLADHLRRHDGLRCLAVDEGHDLSRVENQAITIFSQRNQVVLAGDDEQAINGFRGADHESFTHFGELEGAEVVELTVTWRSSTQLVTGCLNPFRERWFCGREPLVAGNSSPIQEPFSSEVVPGGVGAVFARLATEVASLRSMPRRRGTMGSIPPSVLRGISSIQAPLVGVLCARNEDVDEATAALKEYGIQTIVLRRAARHPRADPLLEVLLAALDPYDRTSFLGGHRDPSWAARHLMSSLAMAPGRKLEGRDLKLVARALKAATDAAPLGSDALRAALASCLGALASGGQSSGLLKGYPAWAQDSLRLINMVLSDGAHDTRGVVDVVDATFNVSSNPAWSSERPLGRMLANASTENDQLVAAQRLRSIDAIRRPRTAAPVGPTVVLGTVNQVKGLTVDLVWILVPSANRFPYDEAAKWEECCRWWVAVTRARHLVRVLVGAGVSVPYLLDGA